MVAVGREREGSDDVEEFQEPRGQETEQLLAISISKYFNNIDEFFIHIKRMQKVRVLVLLKNQRYGMWRVAKVVEHHNHELHSSISRFILPYRSLSSNMKRKLEMHDTAGLTPNKSMRILKVQVRGLAKLGCLPRDCRNYVQKAPSANQPYVVDNAQWVCEKWQTYTLPCSHVLAVCRENGSRTDTYVPEIYSQQTYRRTYQANFHPVLSENFWKDVPFNLTFYPPNMKNEQGRKQGKRFRGKIDYRNPDSPPRCGRCRMLGHNRKNCNNPEPSNV
ncbi:hypothetical protein M9H77_11396 [Catharanthus roseus]|uniref:Uncharacterized protein n=1 Tax=Catharanthus roseus TaxID=4058 RepID=A0ACC0BEG4_CATRO|nr:hypothetical protein M9H77_11396 [Catharanthus roseus]